MVHANHLQSLNKSLLNLPCQWEMGKTQEINAGCRQLIVDHLSWCHEVVGETFAPPCVFGDLRGCLPEKSYHQEDPHFKQIYDINRSKLVKNQWCYTCGKLCPLFGPEASSQFETAGLPCTDSSNAGKRKYEKGPTCSVFCAHAKRHVEKATPIVLIENVQDWTTQCAFWMFSSVFALMNSPIVYHRLPTGICPIR